MATRYDDSDDQGLFGTRGFQRLVIIGFILLALGLLAGKILNDKTLPIRNVQIGGEFKHVGKKDIQKKIDRLVHGNFFTVDIRKIQDIIQSHVWVDKVSIRRVWPDTLRIFINEKKPIARWSSKGLVSASGKLFKVPVRKAYRLLPLFVGPKNYYPIMVTKFLRYKILFTDIGLSIRQVTVTSRRAWRIRLSNGIEVRLGRSNMDFRVTRLVKIYQSVLGKVSNNVRAIDMRYTNGFAVKWKPGRKAKTFAYGG
ncbi:Cell division protein FtsQ [hydrothermal vent metagenome]|uniref:Cell division protein FtsQ n=1 Tax=hydrothermal vent metagenome TaxID=652676 RepID=A0A3B0Y9V7_9ZZZZ